MFWFNNNNPPITQFPADGVSSMTSGTTGRPKIGLALGAGVARGWSHIGVIQQLIEEGIEPDVVSGTSVGALVGGCYAAGKLHMLEDFARSLTRTKIFRLLDISWSKSGMISGDKLRELLDEGLGETRIEHIDKPFICIGTELLTGHEIWLRKGRLSKALRASYALPGVFSPVYFKELWLIDGAVVNPIPVSACRAMGARMVIAVNLNNDAFGGTVIQAPGLAGVENALETPPAGQESNRPQRSILRQMFGGSNDEPGLTTVLMAAFNISQDRLARSRLAGDPADISINPQANGIGMFDFDRASEAIEAGRVAAARVVPDIKRAMATLEAASH
ncbi:MAG: NTE family protein rssA [Rhizobiales bacterium]|nr:NTE family protein rssA [Hyphomicrobiales bacterium]